MKVRNVVVIVSLLAMGLPTSVVANGRGGGGGYIHSLSGPGGFVGAIYTFGRIGMGQSEKQDFELADGQTIRLSDSRGFGVRVSAGAFGSVNNNLDYPDTFTGSGNILLVTGEAIAEYDFRPEGFRNTAKNWFVGAGIGANLFVGGGFDNFARLTIPLQVGYRYQAGSGNMIDIGFQGTWYPSKFTDEKFGGSGDNTYGGEVVPGFFVTFRFRSGG